MCQLPSVFLDLIKTRLFFRGHPPCKLVQLANLDIRVAKQGSDYDVLTLAHFPEI